MNDVRLQDVSTTGRKRPWEVHKVANELLSVAYEEVDQHKADRLRTCANELSFAVQEDGTRRLVGGWFCRVRLCPMCSWRRSLKVAAQMHAILHELNKDDKYAYALLTLTVKNCEPVDLDREITHILKAYNNMMRVKAVTSAICGWYRAMEITHNLTDDTYHPHMHVVLVVNKSYFTSRNYISQAAWTDMWEHALHVNYKPIVDVRKIRGNNMRKAVAEVAKYAMKSGDYIIPDDWEMTVNTVALLDKAIHGRKFVAFGGVVKQTHRMLNLDIPEDGDLVHVDPNEKPVQSGERIVNFIWYSGYRQYRSD